MSRTIPLAFALSLLGCFGPFPQETQTPRAKGSGSGSGSGSAAQTSKQASNKKKNNNATSTAKAKTQASKGGVPGPTDGYLSGAHILISYKGAKRAKDEVTRSKAEAEALAKKLAATLGAKATREQFAALAKKHSDGPSSVQGGDLGVWKQGRMVPAFDRAILTLPFGGVTRDPVQTPFGYHVIMRYEVLPPQTLHAAHVLVAHAGALRAQTSVTRSQSEARALCQKIAKQAQGKDKAGFKKLVEAHSDAPDKARGGILGVWNTRSPGMPSAISKAVRDLAIGKTSAPVTSPFGCHVLMRLKLPPMFAGSHILIAYDGAQRAKATVTRSKDEARKLAEQLIAELSKVKADDLPDRFAELAKKHSDGPSATLGGKLGTWPKGRMVPAFDAAIEKTAINSVVKKPVETPFGYHVILRSKPSIK
ncbi:MAG: peptidylprolyl isomerase [Myxococcales bacterium]|nr:peptidylprolyl isomerase [Myxococcales bacterium]